MLPLTIVPLAYSATSAHGGDHPHPPPGILSRQTQETLRKSGTPSGTALTLQKNHILAFFSITILTLLPFSVTVLDHA